ncbi:MAG: hypothetical protein ACI4DY_11975 [Monoglobaceae bacterium]
MSSTDTLLHYVLQFAKAYNKISNDKITLLQALKIYNEMTKARG